MKTYCSSFIIMIAFLANLDAQEFEFPIYFEDHFGAKDTIVFGYDANATVGVDESFGEFNIKSEPLSDLDVRIVDYNYNDLSCGIYDNTDYSTFHLKRQIVPGNCDEPPFPAFALIIEQNRFPVTIHWDKEIFPETCSEGPILTDWHPGGWFDAPCANIQGVAVMSLVDSISFEPFPSIGVVTSEQDTVSYLFFNFMDLLDDLEDVSPEESIALFPNPTSKRQFRCSLPNIPVNATIHVYSPKGQLLFIEKWTGSDQLFTLPQSGLFYAVIFSNDRQVAVRKVVAID